MRFIKQSSIDAVLEDANIYDVVSRDETLIKKGSVWFCKSPFTTSDDSPSFCVNTVKNNFFDYSQGFGGNAISYLMKRHSLSFFDAITQAAEICKIMIEYEEQSEDAKRMFDEDQQMKKLVEFASTQYQKAFHKLPETHWAKEMIKERQFSDEIIESFGIGFAPDQRDFLSSPIINKGNLEIGISLGLTKSDKGISYDMFRDRIMFPIHDERGIIIGFGGRKSNAESAKEYAKYINSKESKVYRKERVLYGLCQAKKAINTLKEAILLEGYTDVLALHQAGVENAIGSCGTALTELHSKLIARYTKTVILFRDGDKAGQKAAQRDIDILVKEGITVKVVICPENEDPDSLSKQTNISEFIKKYSEDAITWKGRVLKETSLNPDLKHLEETLRDQTEKEIEKIRNDIAPESAFKDLSTLDKKFLKKENDEKFKSISIREKELKTSLEELPRYEPQLFSEAVSQIGYTLHRIPNKIVQAQYVKMVASIFEVKPNIIQQVITDYENKEAAERKKKVSIKESEEEQILGLPKGADKEQYLKDRYCEIGNAYFFQGETGFFKGTNFKITPLFHVEGKAENKRLFEMINEDNNKRLIDLDSKDLINFSRFQERLIEEGNFFFEAGVTVRHFKLLIKKYLNDFISAQELKTLGLQREGFTAFADGVFHNDTFIPVNKYGITHVVGLKKEESEYRSDIKHYYSPAFSEIYKFTSEDDDPYENDRHFVYKKAPISLETWAKQMVTVFGDKGKLGVAFCLASNFRDLFLTHFNYFPLMGGFGQKDSGKSGFGKCIQAFFFYDLQPLELNTSTLVAVARRLQRVKNVVTFFDEVREDIEEEKKQAIKGCWNGIGREKGKGADSNKTSTDKINAALYFCGQYILTGDDGAIPSRTISLMFQNKEHSPKEKEEYQKLMNWCQEGLSSFILDVIKHRQTFKNNMFKVHSECSKDLKTALESSSYENRIYDNNVVLLTVVKILSDFFALPFTYEEYLKLTAEYVIENSELITDSDGLAKFWNILEFLSRPQDLSQPNKTIIKEGEDYQIEREPSFKYLLKKDEETLFQNKDNDQILFLNFKSVHQYYHKEASSRKGEEIIGETTLRNYLKSKKYFIGLFKSRRMGSRTPSGYALNYTMMSRMGILNLDTTSDSQTVLDVLNGTVKTIVTNPNQTNIELPPSSSY